MPSWLVPVVVVVVFGFELELGHRKEIKTFGPAGGEMNGRRRRRQGQDNPLELLDLDGGGISTRLACGDW